VTLSCLEKHCKEYCKVALTPNLTLIFVTLLFGILSGIDLDTIIKSINDGFDNTIGKIGIFIALGVSIIDTDVGLVRLVRLIIGMFSPVVAITFSKHYAARTYIDPNPELSKEVIQEKT